MTTVIVQTKETDPRVLLMVLEEVGRHLERGGLPGGAQSAQLSVPCSLAQSWVVNYAWDAYTFDPEDPSPLLPVEEDKGIDYARR